MNNIYKHNEAYCPVLSVTIKSSSGPRSLIRGAPSPVCFLRSRQACYLIQFFLIKIYRVFNINQLEIDYRHISSNQETAEEEYAKAKDTWETLTKTSPDTPVEHLSSLASEFFQKWS